MYEDLADLLVHKADEERSRRDHMLHALQNAEAYPIDYRQEGKNGGQVFPCGVPNRDKARLAAIIRAQYHRIHLDFNSMPVFSDLAEMPRLDLAMRSNLRADVVSLLAQVRICGGSLSGGGSRVRIVEHIRTELPRA